MLHGPVLALCLAAALAALAGTVWALFTGKHHLSSTLSRQATQQSLGQYLRSSHYAGAIMFSTAKSRSACQEGWSLIHRAGRARSDVRLAVR